MLTFREFSTAAPVVADPIRSKLETTGIGILGTLRKDGSPRLSPVELSFIDDGLYMGHMPQSMKCRDLRRDPRCAVLTPVADRDDLAGEGKLFLHAIEVDDPAESRRLLAAATAHMPDVDLDGFGDSPMWELRVTGAAWQKLEGETWTTAAWRPGQPVRRFAREGADGLPVEVTDAPPG